MADFRFSSPFQFPPVVKNLMIINVLVFLTQNIVGQREEGLVENWFALHDLHSEFFKPHQLITHMFMHGSFAHLFFNMFGLWMFGVAIEHRYGAKRFLQFYIISGLGAALLHLGVLYVEIEPMMKIYRALPEDQQIELMNTPAFFYKLNAATLGASGAVFGCLAAFGYLYPNSIIMINFLLPMKAKWLVLIYAGMELLLAFRNSAGDTVAHFAHLGGALTGFLLVYFWNKRNRRTFYR
ncbi:MAG TPA: rhomboid family intramembrane serine protease [Chitinophagaceae bacterium]|nr:rhomboid family intramembrane serine protease [Chitinophagaceae bacterium]